MDGALKLGTPLNWNVAADPAKSHDPARVREAAQQFESLLIGQMMKTAREAGGGGWLGTEEEAGMTFGEFAEQQLAQVIASCGGFGLAQIISRGLAAQAQPQTSDPASAVRSADVSKTGRGATD